MTANRKRILFFIYIVFTAIFFIYYLFPDEAVKKYIAYKINTISPLSAMTIDRVTPVFPPGLKLENLRISQNNISIVDVAEFKISPGLLSFFRSVKTFFIHAEAYGGNIKGRFDIDDNQPENRFEMESNLSGLQVGDSALLQRLAGRKISGTLAGEFHVKGSKFNIGEVTARLYLTGFRVEFLTPVFNTTGLTFKNVSIDLNNTGDKKIRIKSCTLQGDQVDGNLAGVVEVREPINKSAINLTGMIKPNIQFLADLKRRLPENVLLKSKISKNGFPIRFIGTIDKPIFSLN